MLNILNYYDEIIQNKVVAPASFFEWNTYRVFKKLGGYKELITNFKLDSNDRPYGCAKPGFEDVTIKYDKFIVLVECSLRSGESQLDFEGDSVPRHLKSCLSINNNCSCYTIFLAPKIYLSFAKHIGFEKDKLKIIPLTLEQFKLIAIKFEKNFDPLDFRSLLENLLCDHLGYLDAETWLKSINETITSL